MDGPFASTRPLTPAPVAAAVVVAAVATAVADMAAAREWVVATAAHPSSRTASRNRGTASSPTAVAATVPRLPLHMAPPLSKVSSETATPAGKTTTHGNKTPD